MAFDVVIVQISTTIVDFMPKCQEQLVKEAAV